MEAKIFLKSLENEPVLVWKIPHFLKVFFEPFPQKAAEGISTLVLDIKWGSGCYQESLHQAEDLAQALVQVWC